MLLSQLLRFSIHPFHESAKYVRQISIHKVIDATRVSDGRTVVVKRLKRVSNAEEINITRYFSQEAFLADSRNHCVPMVDVLDPEKGDEVFLVIPLLRYFWTPPVQSVDDAVDFVRQTLEVCYRTQVSASHLLTLDSIQGITFMHEKGVAHRCVASPSS